MTIPDFLGATALRINSKDVLKARINGADIWVKPVVMPEDPVDPVEPPSPVERSLWLIPPSEISSFSDAEPYSWVAQQFYIPLNGTYRAKVLGVKIFVEEDDPLIGTSGYIGIMRRSVADGGIRDRNELFQPTYDTNGSKTPLDRPLVAGWNRFYFPVKYSMEPGDSILIGYELGVDGRNYLFSSSVDDASIMDHAGKGFFLAEREGAAGRSYYRGGSTTASWYGIDIILEDAT